MAGTKNRAAGRRRITNELRALKGSFSFPAAGFDGCSRFETSEPCVGRYDWYGCEGPAMCTIVVRADKDPNTLTRKS
eukprot:scaffold901_cov167-Amphora_coffeaeformis.AAC.30